MSTISTCYGRRPSKFPRFITSGNLSRGPIVTLLTNDQGRRVGSGLPVVLRTTTPFAGSCRLILTKTPKVSPTCCSSCVGPGMPIGVVFKRACELLRRTRTTLIASNATALRATLFHIPRIIYCCAPMKGFVTFLHQRVLGIGCVSLIGLMTSGRIIHRLITSAVAISGIHSRLRSLLCGGMCEGGILRRCSHVVRVLNPTKTSKATTHRVMTLLGGWAFRSLFLFFQMGGLGPKDV